jgi:hypothetical protein
LERWTSRRKSAHGLGGWVTGPPAHEQE